MKDKVDNVPAELRVSTVRPRSTYASSASSTSSYASSLSSASSAAESVRSSSSSFLHSKANPLMEVTPDRHSQYSSHSSQYHTLSRFPATGLPPPSPSTPQLTTPSQSSPSSSPSSSTFDGYAAIPAKYATLSLNPRHDPRIHYPNPSMPTTPLVANYRHSTVSNGGAEYGPHPVSNFTRVVHGDINRSRTFVGEDGSMAPGVGEGMRGISSLGEVNTQACNGPRSAHYASTPHLFVFQSVDDDSSDETIDDHSSRQITKSNTLSNKNLTQHHSRTHLPENVSNSSSSSRTLPRMTSPPQKTSEPIYTTAVEIKKEAAKRQVNSLL